jgi:glycosylphosphatidylinositol transamidase (GPIT) subunit GPI8
MRRQLKAFINGYSNALSLFPNYNINNQDSDWEMVGIDIKISIKNYCQTNEMEKLCQVKKKSNKHKKLK